MYKIRHWTGLSIKLCEEKIYASVSRALTVFDVVGSFRWAVVYLCSKIVRIYIIIHINIKIII